MKRTFHMSNMSRRRRTTPARMASRMIHHRTAGGSTSSALNTTDVPTYHRTTLHVKTMVHTTLRPQYSTHTAQSSALALVTLGQLETELQYSSFIVLITQQS